MEPLSSESIESFEAAEAARKAGEYPRAGKAFHAMWNQQPRASTGWRYAFCLRKAGYPEAALRVIAAVRERFGEDRMVAGEHVWCLYSARLQPAVKADDEQAVLRAANDMISAGADDLALRLAVFAAAGAAKRKGHWKQVGEWCDRLDPSVLETDGRKGERGRLPSERERWYFARIKAFLALDDAAGAEACARQALEAFPRHLDFRRWRARALSELGRHEEAAAEVGVLVRGRAPWYVRSDECLIHSRIEGHGDQAWAAGLEALSLPAEDQARVSLLVLMAQLARQRGERERSVALLGWCMALRTDQKWPLSEVHTGLRAELEADGPLDWSGTARDWKRRWQELSPAPVVRERRTPPPKTDTPKLMGTVEGVLDDRPFAFIKVGKERHFVFVRDIPEDLRAHGTRVSFHLIPSFDKKKNRESQRAVDVTPAGDLAQPSSSSPPEPAGAAS